ncbi:hypothetical protein Tco_1177751 [Tanacetum coccineum]
MSSTTSYAALMLLYGSIFSSTTHKLQLFSKNTPPMLLKHGYNPASTPIPTITFCKKEFEHQKGVASSSMECNVAAMLMAIRIAADVDPEVNHLSGMANTTKEGHAAEKLPCTFSLWYLNRDLVLKNMAHTSLSVILTSGWGAVECKKIPVVAQAFINHFILGMDPPNAVQSP